MPIKSKKTLMSTCSTIRWISALQSAKRLMKKNTGYKLIKAMLITQCPLMRNIKSFLSSDGEDNNYFSGPNGYCNVSYVCLRKS